jgi:hypothetical protein
MFIFSPGLIPDGRAIDELTDNLSTALPSTPFSEKATKSDTPETWRPSLSAKL